jgi:hypothetical protein
MIHEEHEEHEGEAQAHPIFVPFVLFVDNSYPFTLPAVSPSTM